MSRPLNRSQTRRPSKLIAREPAADDRALLASRQDRAFQDAMLLAMARRQERLPPQAKQG